MMILNQLRNNAVAIISLVVALSGLGYNTWRNESSEANKNVRDAGLFMMQELTELQEVVFYARYDRQDERGDIKTGWVHVLAVKDLSFAMPTPVQESASNLSQVWSDHSSGLAAEEAQSYQAVDASIETIKQQIVVAIKALR